MEASVANQTSQARMPAGRSSTRLADFLAAQVADPDAQWSLGTFGAIAEFSRDTEEAVRLGPLSAVTERGAMSLERLDGLQLFAFETVTRDSWSSRVALCLSREASVMSQRSVLTELGHDHHALRPEDSESILFDVGIGAWQTDVCVRVQDPSVVAHLREQCGTATFAPGSRAGQIILEASPHRVFVSRIGRIEVYQPIPPAHGKSPEGPHTHVLTDLLRHRRTHAATEPIPAGLVPCVHLYPAHPSKDTKGFRRAFDPRRRDAFDAILQEFGDPKFVELKERVRLAVMEGKDPSYLSIAGRFTRTTIRVALRQLRDEERDLPALPMWLSAHDAVSVRLEDDDSHIHHR